MHFFRSRMKAILYFVFYLVNLAKGCDETIEAEIGTFTSPNYPNNYPNNQQCTYTIIVPVGRTIQLTFTAFDTEADNFGAGCFDYVTIDGGAEMCGTNVPTPVSSQSNRMRVIFSSDYSEVRRGFSASFTSQTGSNDIGTPTSSPTATDAWGLSNPGGPTSAATSVDTPSCDETIEAEIGTFTSPNYPNHYPNNQRCTYTIIVPVGRTIQLTFTAFDTEADNFGAGCFDYVTIDGGAQMCGTNVPTPVSSQSNRMRVIFSSDYSQVHRGFSASFTSQTGSNDIGTDSWGLSNPGGPTSAATSVDTPSCDATIEAASGSFTSPEYPNNYPNNQQCTYTIIVPEGRTIQLTFTAFDIEEDTDYSACYDHVTIDGGTQMCGSNIPAPVRSGSNRMVVIFLSDYVTREQGFSATFTSQTGSNEIGTFTSLLESNDLPTATDPWETNDVSDSWGLSNPGGPTSAAPSVNTPSCDATIEAASGSFTSPEYPNNYPNNQQCTYTIIVPDGRTILLTFTAFDIEEEDPDYLSCYDYVTVDGGAQMCGSNMPAPVRSGSNRMVVIFLSDYVTRKQGFSATFTSQTASTDTGTPTSSLESNNLPTPTGSWTATAPLAFTNQGGPTSATPLVDLPSCDANFESQSGTFTSPNYPNNYPNIQLCNYTIIVPEGRTIQLTFTAFDIEESSGCIFDYIRINSDRYCGVEPPAPLHSDTNIMTVIFNSDYSRPKTGFSATFTSSTIPISPGATNDLTTSTWVPNNQDGSTGPGTTVEAPLGVPNDLPTSTREPTNQDEPSDPGTTVPIPPGATNDLTTSTWVPNNQDGSTGPSTTVEIPPGAPNDLHTSTRVPTNQDGATGPGTTNCNEEIEAEKGVIRSPNYPNNYPDNKECMYKIRVPKGMTVLLKFTDFNIEHESTCRADYITVDSGDRLCGQSIPSSITSDSNIMTIQFRSDSTVAKSGFVATFSSQTPDAVVTTTESVDAVVTTTESVDAVVTTTESVEGGTDTGDAVSILLVSIGVVAGLCVTSVVAGIFYLKFTKNNVVDLQKKTKRSKTRKKRKAPEVRELSDYPAFKPPRSVLYPIKTKLGKESELTMVDA